MGSKLTRAVFVCHAILFACALIISSCAGTTQPSEKRTTHIVQKGETVWSIARKYGVKPEEIIALNKLEEPDKVSPGQELIIPRAGASVSSAKTRLPASRVKHIVQKGETVWSIARKYGVKTEEIIKANNLKKPDQISPGHELIVPGVVTAEARRLKIASLCRLPRGVRPRRWRYIIIHHSGTRVGNAAIFGRHHKRLGMKNGLAYHFVIGNGTRSGDGETEVGGRWTKQLQGGHVRSSKMNEIAIGICLVGDFEKTHPTRRQMESVVSLVRYLVRRYNIPKSRVVGHRDVNSTDCPGKNFSLTLFRKKL